MNIAKLLLDNGAGVNVQDDVGDSPLHVVVMYHSLKFGGSNTPKKEVGRSVCLSVYSSICQSVCLSVRQSVCLSVRQSIIPSVCLLVRHLSVSRHSARPSLSQSVFVCVSVSMFVRQSVSQIFQVKFSNCSVES